MALQMSIQQITSDSLYCSINGFEFKIRIYFIEKDDEKGIEYLHIASTNPPFTGGLGEILDVIKRKNPIEVNILNSQKQKVLGILSPKTNKVELFQSSAEGNLNFEASFIVTKE